MEVYITKSKSSEIIHLANPVYLSVTPLTVGDALSRGVISEYDPENPFSPNRASKNILKQLLLSINFLSLFTDYLDFNYSKQQAMFSEGQRSVILDIPIVDDDIDEADEQVFIVFLEVVNATNYNKVNINRQFSIGRISDNESKWFSIISDEWCVL